MLSWDRRLPIWLLDYDVGGRVFRYATERAEPSDAEGDAFLYEPGLDDVSVGALYMLGRRSQRVTLKTSDDWALIDARGIRLDDREATLRVWFSGDALELAGDVSTGRTEGVSYREQFEAIEFEIVTDTEKDAIVLPDTQAVASDETWPVRANYELTKGADGQPYPIVIGYPGDHPKPSPGISLGEPTCPALWVERRSGGSTQNERWLISMGEIEAQMASLWVLTADSLESTDLATATMFDELGRLITYVETSALANDDQKFWAGFRNTSGWGGGLLSPYTGEILRDANEVIRYMLDYFGGNIEIDETRFAGVDGWLSRFKIDACIAERVNVVQWLNEQVLPLLPVIGAQGARGYYLAPMRWDATALDAVAYLDADKRQVALDGNITGWTEPIRNMLTLEYRFSNATGGANSRRTLTSIQNNIYETMTGGANLPPFSTSLPWIATTEEDARVLGSSICRWSQAQHGVHEWSATTEVIWDDATANLILQYMALKHAWRKRLARYVGGMELKALSPGDVVVLNDSSVHLTDAVCLVQDRILSVTDVALDLIILDHPFQRTISTT